MSKKRDQQQDARPESEEPGFEQNIEKLEKVVAQLEQGNLPLDEALRLYEEGIQAYRACQGLLKDADERVTKLVETLEGELREEPFDVPEEQ